ncbi:MAG: hypothetical protein COA97_03905 [Flavobacteriales bacterium]|nr:MAG: hypothetical protein COA97_03905 [Flavobacteriales bacterium]
MKKIGIILLVFITLSCTKTQYDDYETSSGNADFSNYVAVGNSLTQGYQDGGMHNEFGQQDNSYPAIIARQMGVNFIQPTVPPLGQGYMHLEYRNGEIEVIKAYDADITNNDPTAIDDDPGWIAWGDTAIQYNNLGVSGIKLVNCLSGGKNTTINFNLLQTALNENGRFLNFGDAINPITYLDHIRRSKATFFTCWLGNNDVLGWSTEGGDNDSIESTPGLKLTELSDFIEFRDKYDSVLTAFVAMGSKGVCATLPDVTSIPYFNTVTLEAVNDDVWIREGADTSVVRLATENDLLLLTASDELAEGIGKIQSKPLPHTVVLDKDEIFIVQSRTNEINNAIRLLASKHGFALADMNQFMKTLTNTGISYDGIDFSPDYIEGGVFSLDGVHPNGRGYALIANEFIRVINDFYGSSIQTVAVGNYRGITFP